MELDELPGEGQSEPRAFRLLVRRSHLSELLEHGLLILWRDPDTAVSDGDLDQPIGRSRPDVDPAALGGELDRVRQEIQQDLFDLALIRSDVRDPVVNDVLEGDPAAKGSLADQRERILNRLREIEICQLELSGRPRSSTGRGCR